MGRQTNYGVGYLHFVPPSGFTGDLTPIEAGTLQEVSLDFTSETKELMGNNAVPVDVRNGALKISGKAKWGEIKGAFLQAVFPSSMVTADYVISETYKKPALLAVHVFDSGIVKSDLTFVDLGAYDASGNALTKWYDATHQFAGANQFPDGTAGGTSMPATAYCITSSGANWTYTFEAAQAGTFAVSYSQKVSSTGSKIITLSNYLQGSGTKFQCSLLNKDVTANTQFGVKLYAIVLSKFSLAMKNNDFTLSDVDFTAFADANDKVFDFIVSK